MAPSHWIIGGDGWAYDIGFGGLDHVLATGAERIERLASKPRSCWWMWGLGGLNPLEIQSQRKPCGCGNQNETIAGAFAAGLGTHFSTYQAFILEFRFFEPQPCFFLGGFLPLLGGLDWVWLVSCLELVPLPNLLSVFKGNQKEHHHPL